MYYFYSKKGVLSIERKYLKVKASIVKGIVSDGLAPFSMQLAASVVTALYNTNLQAYGGDLATSSMGVINSFFQTTGQPKQATFLSLSRQVVILIIPALMILPKVFGLTGIWMSGALADLLSSVIAIALIINSVRKLK